MATVELEFLYATLSGISTIALGRSCNVVLHRDIDRLQRSVGDLCAAFVKLEEVRRAVQQLETEKGPSGRSARLTETIEKTLELHMQLAAKMEQVMTGFKVGSSTTARRSGIKRARTEDSVRITTEEISESSSDSPSDTASEWSGSSVSADSSDDSSDSETTIGSSSGSRKDSVEEPKSKKLKPSDEERRAEQQSQPIVLDTPDQIDMRQRLERCRDVMLAVRVRKNKIKQVELREKWMTAQRDLKDLLVHAAGWGADASALTLFTIAGEACIAAAVTYQKFSLSHELTTEVTSMVNAVAEASKSRLAASNVTFSQGRKKLKAVVTHAVDQTPAKVQALLREESRAQNPQKARVALEALHIVQFAMKNDVANKLEDVVAMLITRVKDFWVPQLPLQSKLCEEYQRFVGSIKTYAKNFNPKEQAEWQRRCTSILDSLRIRQSGTKTSTTAGNKNTKSSTSSPSTPPALSKKIQRTLSCLPSVLSQLSEWQRSSAKVALTDFTKLWEEFAKLLVGVRNLPPTVWDFKTDPSVRECIDKLEHCIGLIPPSQQKKRLKTLRKWKGELKKPAIK